VVDYVAARKAAGSVFDLHLAIQATPENPELYALIATAYQRESVPPRSSGDREGYYGNDADARATYYSRFFQSFTPAAALGSDQRQQTDVKRAIPLTETATAAQSLLAKGEEDRNADVMAKNLTKDLAFHQQSAEQGDAVSMFRLGVMYALGDGVEKDEAKSVEWYRRASELNFADAQYNLGVRYTLGRGVAKDEKRGIELYRKAAAQGHKEAIEALRQRGL
jgi:TPR repeat protein